MAGNTPPTDLLQHVPPDASRADVLSLGCGDLRNILYSILLHGRFDGTAGGRTPRALSFTQNDWEPAIHARNIILLQMILDSRNLVEGERDAVSDITHQMAAASARCDAGEAVVTEACSAAAKQNGTRTKRSQKKGAKKKGPGKVPSGAYNAVADAPDEVTFAQRMGVIFSAMYNTFVDADVLTTIHDVARRLAASTASSDAWASTDLGRIIRFTDDRSRERVRDVLTRYTDDSLQGKRFAAKVKGQRASFIAKFVPENTCISSRTFGLASSRLPECGRAYSEMRSHYIKHGNLDPFPLLRATKGSLEPRGPGELVNPLLLVTERKGLAYCLHYGSFPLDAFHTDVVWWKLRPEQLQDEYGEGAPRVTKHRELNSLIGKDRPTTTAVPHRIMQEAWMGAALEELAQMCGAFLRVTSTAVASTAEPKVEIIVHVGDALNFCDALVAMPHAVIPERESAQHEDGCSRRFPSSPATPPLFFQQGSLTPLHFCGDIFTGRPQFDVISTSNLAEHLGLVNLLVATAPLLRKSPHAVLLTSLMASLRSLPTYKDTSDFYRKIMCMTPQAASILLGIVPTSSLSSVVGQADTLTRLTIERPELWPSSGGPTGGMASPLRLPWKHAALTFAEASASGVRVEISPGALVDLTLPVYKAMMSHIPTMATLMSGPMKMSRDQGFVRALATPNHYTPASFGRLLRLAGSRLRLGTEHFQAALDATIDCSGLSLASNLAQEQVALFQALDLAPIRKSYGRRMKSLPLDTRRVVLLVPQSGINLLGAFITPEVFLSLTAKNGAFDNHFVSIHMAYVQVHRGSGNLNGHKEQSADEWRSLNGHLAVRDTREDDPEAELMVSAVVPTFGLLESPPALVEVILSPRAGLEVLSAPKETKERLGMGFWKRPVFFKANLADVDRTAILTPGRACQPARKQFPRQLSIPAKTLRGECGTDASACDDEQGPRGQTCRQGLRHGHPAVHQSVELTTQVLGGDRLRMTCTVTLRMVSDGARQGLNSGAPHLEKTSDLCSVRVTLGEGFSQMVCLPFPVQWNAVHVKFSKRQGFVALTVPPADRPFPLPVMRMTCGVSGNPSCSPLLPSSPFWSPCAPLASLPRLDFKAEWAHKMVHGIMSIHLSERASLREATSGKTGEKESAIVGLKKSFLHISAIVCENHSDDRPGWKHPWVCITEGGDRGKRAIWIWVNDILLDSSNEALILDCCILPVDRVTDGVSARLEIAVAQDNGQSGPGISFIEASTGEVDLWDSLLPAGVERARETYTHAADCLYNNLGEVRPRLCNCGKGEDLPRAFMLPIRTARATGQGPPLHTLVYRAALSPLYAPTETACFPPVGETPGANDIRNAMGHAPKCAKCGKGGHAMKCARCHSVFYCSKECQRKDWKRHKPACA